ncbi:MAG TPA: ATP-binding protein, partial [Ferruginibacter sp.]|nr:ATP-binding protein [Ferruginibacter sp.]
FLLVKEAVNNAIKHAGADIIRLEWKYESNLSVIIEDNGSGFDPENPTRKGNGLHHYQKRCADIHGQYRIDAQPGRGTRIQFTVAV